MYLNNQKPKDIHECIKRLKEGCERLAEEYGADDFGLFDYPVTEEQIKAVEEELGIKLPNEYREFVKVSDGAWMMQKRLYGIKSIGMSDPYVPDGYLALSYNELTTERLAISETDGKLYMFWDSEPDEWTFEEYLMNELEKCEENIIDIQRENEDKLKDPETLKREEEEEREAAEAKERINKILEERRRKNNG